MAIRQITIVGTGLIGGSLGLALRERGFDGTVIGCDKPEVVEMAVTRGAVDRGASDIKEATRDSDVVVFATPVRVSFSLLEKLAPALPPDTLFTDTGSTKGELVEFVRLLLGESAGERMLPGHPMAGKEQGGIENADGELFRDAAWLVTPIRAHQTYTARQLEYLDLLRSIGARVVAIEPERHDRLCAWISELPQMISTALASLLHDELHADREAAQIGGRALCDMTRIARSPFSMWGDIAMTNTVNLEKALLRFEQEIAHLRENLRGPGLREMFENANEFGKGSSQ